jgi:hypothetical protein
MVAAIGAVGMGATLAGGILGAVGAEKTGAAQQQMYNYQAGVAKINSQIDLQNADYARNQGEIQATQFGLKEAQQEANIKVAQSASNLDVNSGSAVDVQRSQRTLGQMDLTQIRSNAAKVAYDFDVKSTMDLNQSTLDVMAGANAKTAGDINAMSSIIGSVGSVSSKWMQGNTAGMYGSGVTGGGGGNVDSSGNAY